jgi:redox-sensing transcriptional repressor
MAAKDPAQIPEATVARLPLYLLALQDLAADHVSTVSSGELAELAGVNAAKVRKDLSHFGSYGTRGVGYAVEYLVFNIRRALGLTHDLPTVIVGMGNLGRALANYGGFVERGFLIAGVFDADESKVGTRIGDLVVQDLSALPEVIARSDTSIGVIATPAAVAQQVADELVAAGITSILNFAPTVLATPDDIAVRKVDLAMELQILSFYNEHRDGIAQAG